MDLSTEQDFNVSFSTLTNTMTLRELESSSENITIISVAQLNDISGLILDLRSQIYYDSGHLIGANCFSLPTILLRRFIKSSSEPGILPDFSYDQLSSEFKTLSKVIMYDESSMIDSDIHVSNPLRIFATYIAEIEKCPVYIVDGGFKAISEQLPEQIKIEKNISVVFPKETFASIPSPTVFPGDINFVDDFIAVGAQVDAENIALLKEKGVTHVLNVTKNPFNKDVAFELETLQISLNDTLDEDILCVLPDAIDFIEKCKSKSGRMLIHCFAGISRSVSIAIAYQMLSKQISLAKATDIVKKHRACASPNLNFCGQLMYLENAMKLNLPVEQRPTLYEACKNAHLLLDESK
jgi:predicted protein tyrosine phosphatase